MHSGSARLNVCNSRRVLGTISLSWSELGRRTWREALDDDVPGLAAQLAYDFFLALFPALLFLLALASFFPLGNVTDDVARSLGPFVSPQVLELIQEQMRRLANNDNGGLLTFGVAAALWSSSAALVSIVGALNRAYDIEEGRPWWKVRLVAIGLTLGVAVIVLVALSLVLGGPALAERLGQTTGWGAPFEWTWLVLQWPLVFALVTTGIGLIFYFGPDADQDWVWISPGAVAATILWLLVSLLFKLYIANFTDYEALLRHGRRGHRRPSLVLHIRYRHPCGRRTQRRNRTRVSVRESASAEERARKAAHRAACGARISRTSASNRIGAHGVCGHPGARLTPGDAAGTNHNIAGRSSHVAVNRAQGDAPGRSRPHRCEHHHRSRLDETRVEVHQALSTSCGRSRRDWRRIGTRYPSGPRLRCMTSG